METDAKNAGDSEELIIIPDPFIGKKVKQRVFQPFSKTLPLCIPIPPPPPPSRPSSLSPTTEQQQLPMAASTFSALAGWDGIFMPRSKAKTSASAEGSRVHASPWVYPPGSGSLDLDRVYPTWNS